MSLLNLGGRKAGPEPGTEDERDPEQVRQAIEGVRALLPIVEPLLGQDAAQIREALSQLQLAYTRIAGGEGDQPAETAPAADDQRSPTTPARPSRRAASGCRASNRHGFPSY